jgi:hypothetical protein
MLDSGVGFDQLLRAAKHAYVKAAISEVIPSGSRLNVSRLSVATGLTRKEVAAVVGHLTGTHTQSPNSTKEQRALRVLRGWLTDPRFHSRRGRPAVLQSRGELGSFQHLVREYGGDVTPAAVLRELERMRAVRLTRARTVQLRSRRISGPIWAERAAELTRLFGDFAESVIGPHSAGQKPEFFGFRECEGLSPDEVALFQRTFARRGAALLESFQHWTAARDPRLRHRGATRVGLGIYLIHGPSRSAWRS